MIWFSASCISTSCQIIGLARFPFAYDFGVRFEQPEQFVRQLGQAGEYSCLRLSHHPTHLIGHRFQTLA
jgi:hypothetical protein